MTAGDPLPTLKEAAMLGNELSTGIDFGGHADDNKSASLSLLNSEISEGSFDSIEEVNPCEVEPRCNARLSLIKQGVGMIPDVSPLMCSEVNTRYYYGHIYPRS